PEAFQLRVFDRRHGVFLSLTLLFSRGCALVSGDVWPLGTCVVHTPSPWAIVAIRCTWVPSSRAKTSVSASHSCGNCSATCATGQWCWHSCSPSMTGEDCAEAA